MVMGYDMRWRGHHFRDGCPSNMVDGFNEDICYYRLNIWGMGRCRDLMVERGMVFGGAGVTSEEWESGPEWADEDEPGYDEYRRWHDSLVGRMEIERVGIPIHKFGSNDGWWVRSLEIGGALANYEKWLTENEETTDVPWWPTWVGWMRAAMEHDGFEVY